MDTTIAPTLQPRHEDRAPDPSTQAAPFDVAGSHIVVEFDAGPKETKTEGGLLVVEDRKDRPSVVRVVGVGPEATVNLWHPRVIDEDGRHLHDTPIEIASSVLEVGDEIVVSRGRLVPIVMPRDERELHIVAPEHVIGVMRAPSA